MLWTVFRQRRQVENSRVRFKRFMLAFHNVPHDITIQMRLTASSFCHLILVHSSSGHLQTLSNKDYMIRSKKCVLLISDTEVAS